MEKIKNSKVVAIMSIDIGDGRIGKIALRQNDDVEKLAIDFCETYQLSKTKVAQKLAEHIEKTLANSFGVRNMNVMDKINQSFEREIPATLKGTSSTPESYHPLEPIEYSTEDYDSMPRMHCDREVLSEDGSFFHWESQSTKQKNNLSVLKDLELMNQTAYKKELMSIENRGKIGYSVLSPSEYLRVGNRLYDNGMKLIEKKRELCESARNRWLQSRQSRKWSGPESLEFQHLYTSRPRSAPRERASRSDREEDVKTSANRSASNHSTPRNRTRSAPKERPQPTRDAVKNVHERLYQEVKRRMTSLEQSIQLKQKQQAEQEKEFKQKSSKCKSNPSNSAHSLSSFPDNSSIFNRLYEEAETLRRKRESEISRHDEDKLKKVLERESQFVKGLQLDPFQPDIGLKARQLKRDNWDRRLENLMKSKKVEEEQNQIKHLTQELKECTFKPKISDCKRMLSARTHEGNVHEHLYEEAFSKKPSQSYVWESVSSLKTPTKKLSREQEQAMVSRLQSPYQLDLKLLSRDESITSDPKGLSATISKLLWSPDYSSGQTRIKGEGSQEKKISIWEAQRIGEKQFSVYKESERRKAYMMAERDRQMDETRNAPKSCKGSKKIIENAKEQHLRYIFAALDRDGDGLVTPPTLPVQVRSQAKLLGHEETASVIMPVLMKCAEFSPRPLTFDQFKQACLAEFKTPLSNGFSPWHVIFGITSLKKGNRKLGVPLENAGDDSCSENSENHSAFSEAMSLNTFIDERVSVTSQDQNESQDKVVKEFKEGPNDFYEKSIQRQKIRDAVLAELREMKEREDLKECTFKPNIRSG